MIAYRLCSSYRADQQPHYGYFSKNVIIFTPPEEGYDFGSFRDTAHFQETVAERYEREYGNLELTAEKEGKASTGGLGRQVWHTPTELFKVRSFSPHHTCQLRSRFSLPFAADLLLDHL